MSKNLKNNPNAAASTMKVIVNMCVFTGSEQNVLTALVYGHGREWNDVRTLKPYRVSSIAKRARLGLRRCKIVINSLEARGFVEVSRLPGAMSAYSVTINPDGSPAGALRTPQPVHSEHRCTQNTGALRTPQPVHSEHDTGALRPPHAEDLYRPEEEGGSAGEVEQPAPSVVPSPSLDEDGLHPWERADAVDNLGWPIEADETKGESDEQDRSSGDDAADRSSDEPDRGAGRGTGDDAQGGRPPRPSGRAAGCEGGRAGESDATRADAVRTRAGVVDPNEWVERIKTACSGPVTPAPEGWAELRQLLADSAGMQSVAIERDLRQWAQQGHSLLNAQGLHTPAQRVAVMLAGYRGCIKAGSAAPRALWIVERGCRQTVLAKAEAPKMRPLQPAGPMVIRNKTSAARFAALEQS